VAAELLVPHRADLTTQLLGLQRRMHRLQADRLRQLAQRADRAVLRLQAARPQARLALLCRRQDDAARRLQAGVQRRLDAARARLRHADAVLRACHPERRLALLRQRLIALRTRPQAAITRRLQGEALGLRNLARSLEAVSPLSTIARGYAILQHPDGRVVRKVGEASPGDRLEARLQDGVLGVRVEGELL
jgi:exodeoxyribonuclease VII large subunit